jgi:hypothetical protein
MTHGASVGCGLPSAGGCGRVFGDASDPSYSRDCRAAGNAAGVTRSRHRSQRDQLRRDVLSPAWPSRFDSSRSSRRARKGRVVPPRRRIANPRAELHPRLRHAFEPPWLKLWPAYPDRANKTIESLLTAPRAANAIWFIRRYCISSLRFSRVALPASSRLT